MASTQDLMNAIAQMEGWNVRGSISQRNNNPGNLRWAKTQIGQENTKNGKYATFATPEDGWKALQDYVQSKQESGDTLRSFIYRYAPPTENDTTNYLSWLVNKLGLGADDKISLLESSQGGDPISNEDGEIQDYEFGDPSESGYGNIALMVGLGIVGAVVLSKIVGR